VVSIIEKRESIALVSHIQIMVGCDNDD